MFALIEAWINPLLLQPNYRILFLLDFPFLVFLVRRVLTKETNLLVEIHFFMILVKFSLCLCLLDLSAALDATDHSVRIEHLWSWFGTSRIALNRIKSYLNYRSFHVKVKNYQSSVFQLLCGIPHGSVLGPHLFTLYTPPPCTVISHSGAHHHLYAYDIYLDLHFYYFLRFSQKRC
jgi:Reverse transcriptase (RNA-dependent DNA polymerase)